MYFLGSKHKVPFGMEHPPITYPGLYVCRSSQRSQIFKQNSNISIGSHFIEFLRFRLLRLQGVGQVGGGVSGDTEEFPYMDTYMCAHMHTFTCMYH